MDYIGISLQEREGDYYFEDSVLAATHDGKHFNKELRSAFMQKHNLRRSNSRMYPYWLRLLPKGMRRVHWGWKGPEEAYTLMESHSVCDHDMLLVKNEQYVYITQPYNLTLERYLAVKEYWEKLGLSVGISMLDAWWYPGRTPLVVISQIPIVVVEVEEAVTA